MEIEYCENFDIKKYTTFKIGGKISKVYFPQNLNEMLEILRKNPEISVLGNLSNTLVSTNGCNKEIVLTSNMKGITINDNKVKVQCGVKGPKLAQVVCEHNLSGFEFMIGFPGSVGGEICMNASANKQTISDKIVSILCYSPDDGLIKLTKNEMNFDYRTSRCQNERLIVLEAEFCLDKKSKEEIKNIMDENLKFRKNHQPSLALPNCGSIFKNPPTDSAGRLLESIGAKELNIGGVKVWRNHANFIVNNNNGTSMDVLTLMWELKERVKDFYNIELEPEIRYLGGNNKKEDELWLKLNKK